MTALLDGPQLNSRWAARYAGRAGTQDVGAFGAGHCLITDLDERGLALGSVGDRTATKEKAWLRRSLRASATSMRL